MCPDRQIISLYHDNELPSPWKEKMISHLESCSECRSVLSGYNRLGERFLDASANAGGEAAETASSAAERISAAQERVWKKLTAPEILNFDERAGTGRKEAAKTGWNRSITIPLPAAAAAVLAIAVSFVFAGMRGAVRPSVQQDSLASASAANIGLDEKGIVPIQDMNEVLQYLSSQDSGDFMVIRLPETRTFSRIGEPTLVNAADYSRRNVFP